MPRPARYCLRPWFAGLALVLAAGRAPAAEPGVEFFEKHIRPVLAEKCYRCHSANADKVRGGLLLDTRDGVLKGGDNGPAVVSGHPEKSRLLAALKGAGDAKPMPPKEPLPAEVVARFEAWVKMGAPDPRTAAAPGSAIDFERAKSFWSFQPVRDPPVPANRSGLSAIDAFLAQTLADKGLTPAGPADRRTLVRRVTFDLTGLPPTPAEVEAFVADRSPDAFAKLVDQLLDSPAYGEHWGRHWLDLVRYADTCGDNSDFPVPTAYKYRDYVIRSFNADKPYDRFLKEQIAGDILPPVTDGGLSKTDAQRHEQIIATGYLTIARRYGSLANEFHLTIEDVIDNLGKTALGLSVGCARCHDHKFDPVSSADYYALYGIFDSTKFAFPGTEIFPYPKDYVALGPPAEAEALRKYEAETDALSKRHDELTSERRRLYAAQAAGTDPPAGSRTLAAVEAEMKQVKDRQADLEKHFPTVPRAYAVGEGKPHDARIQQKGDPKLAGDVVPRGFLTILGGQRLPPDEHGSGRRELAEWITDPKNPLTARVMVNRIWQHHFGRGLVATPNDFGSRGERPSHPELLDWLAVRFVESGWSVKAMHRLMLNTAAYQRAGVSGEAGSPDDARNAAIDVNNVFLWKHARRRLTAEETRDALLAVAGTLDRSAGGPHPFPPEGTYKYTQHHQFVAVYPSVRRSVYLMQQRIKKHPFLEVFDGADPNATTAIRPVSTTPLQALFLMNDPFAHEQAAAWAGRLAAESVDDAARIDRAYREAFARPATRQEVALGEQFLDACRSALAEAGVPEAGRAKAAWPSYARVLMSSNEFVFVD
ncbi:MAG TPA: PSD1 and planctomycete cytochrome C domain-containing protein [Gemmataceae bacterium]|jgi:hypothetical protein